MTRQALLPGVPYIGGSHLVIWKHTRYVEPALTLIRYINSVDAQARLVQTSGLFPTRLEVLTREPFQQRSVLSDGGRRPESGSRFPDVFVVGAGGKQIGRSVHGDLGRHSS